MVKGREVDPGISQFDHQVQRERLTVSGVFLSPLDQ